MNSTIKKISVFFFIFASFSSFAQYNYDLGLKVSSFRQERFQIEQRFHLESGITLVSSYAFGPRVRISGADAISYTDTTVTVNHYNYSTRFHTVKFGVQRKLSGFASDVFYAGATLAFGYQKQKESEYHAVYPYQVGIFPTDYSSLCNEEELSSTFKNGTNDILNTQFSVSFGMDVPLTERLVLNAELAIAGIFSNSLSRSSFVLFTIPSISGGIRYQFGKQG